MVWHFPKVVQVTNSVNESKTNLVTESDIEYEE